MKQQPTTHQVALAAERAEALAWSDALRAAGPEAAEACGLALREEGGAMAGLARRIDAFALNRVIGLGVETPATEELVARLVEVYREAGVARYFVQLSPEARPPELVEWLRDRGLVHYDDWMKLFYRRQAIDVPVIAADVEVERIGRGGAGDFGRIVTEAFAWPPPARGWLESMVGREGWRHYVVREEGEAVAAAALWVEGNVGWLGFAGTAPSFRRRGAQTALIGRRMHDAVELGCKLLVSETSGGTADRPAASFRNLRRLGFEVLYARPNYANVRPAEPPQEPR